MPDKTPPARAGVLWLIAAGLALVALLLGLWDLVIERDGGGDWLRQVVLPLVFLILTLAMHRRERTS